MATLEQIQDFLACKRVAMVGVSRNANDFTRTLFREFVSRGYDVVPVHPGVCEVEGRQCCAHIRDITPPVEALLVTAPGVTDFVVRDCAAAGVTRVWMYRATGSGAVSRDAVAFCESQGMSVVDGECPFMFFPKAEFPHRAHGWWRRMTGRLPRPAGVKRQAAGAG